MKSVALKNPKRKPVAFEKVEMKFRRWLNLSSKKHKRPSRRTIAKLKEQLKFVIEGPEEQLQQARICVKWDSIQPDALIIKSLKAYLETWKSRTSPRPAVRSDRDLIQDVKTSNPATLTEGRIIGQICIRYRMVSSKIIDQVVIPMYCNGCCIPFMYENVHSITNLGALFILVVDDYSIFSILVEEEFYIRFRCIILHFKKERLHITMRHFMFRMKKAFDLPVLALFHLDPIGISNLCKLEEDGNEVRWLGIRHADLEDFDKSLFASCYVEARKKDLCLAQLLLEDLIMKGKWEWCNELRMILKTNKTIDFQRMFVHERDFFLEAYLPKKLQDLKCSI